MATFLDVTGVSYFSNIFVFIFTVVVVFGVLSYVKVLGDNKFVYAIMAFVIGLLVLISPTSVDIIISVAPITAVLMLFVVLLNTALKMIGGDLEGMHSFKMVFLMIVILIVLITSGIKLRESVDGMELKKDTSKTLLLIFHPLFLGSVMLFAIAVFTIAFMTAKGGH